MPRQRPVFYAPAPKMTEKQFRQELVDLENEYRRLQAADIPSGGDTEAGKRMQEINQRQLQIRKILSPGGFKKVLE